MPTFSLLIDADIIAYRSCAAAEKEVEWEADEWSITCDHAEARASFEEQVSYLKEQAGVANALLCFSDTSNFRKKVDPSYKGNRQSRKPVGYKAFRHKLMEDHKIISVCKPFIEADDCIGILATMARVDTAIIWSADKDLKQIPGLHLTDEGVVTVSDRSADEFFYKQVLTGDQADNYSGCPRIGPKKAEAVLSSVEDGNYWPAVISVYEKAGLSEADALTQARLARILRASDWDKAKQEPILWTPPATV